MLKPWCTDSLQHFCGQEGSSPAMGFAGFWGAQQPASGMVSAAIWWRSKAPRGLLNCPQCMSPMLKTLDTYTAQPSHQKAYMLMRLSGVIVLLPGIVNACLTPTCWGRACAGPPYRQCRPTQPHRYPAYAAASFLDQPTPAPVWPCYPMFRSVARPTSELPLNPVSLPPVSLKQNHWPSMQQRHSPCLTANTCPLHQTAEPCPPDRKSVV